jgi:hypothetical protein
MYYLSRQMSTSEIVVVSRIETKSIIVRLFRKVSSLAQVQAEISAVSVIIKRINERKYKKRWSLMFQRSNDATIQNGQTGGKPAEARCRLSSSR